jgi:hypothetical protein
MSVREGKRTARNAIGLLAGVSGLCAVTLSPNEGPWSFSLYGNNLTNDVSFGGVTPLPDSPLFGGDGAGPRPAPRAAPLNEGRVWGAELRLRF